MSVWCNFCFAKQPEKKALVIDQCSHLGGNVYCENAGGVNVHKYGAHIFHISNKKGLQVSLIQKEIINMWDYIGNVYDFLKKRVKRVRIFLYKDEYCILFE